MSQWARNHPENPFGAPSIPEPEKESERAYKAALVAQWEAEKQAAPSPYEGLTAQEVLDQMDKDNAQLRRYAENGDNLVWLVERAETLASRPLGWSREQHLRSWAEWHTVANATLARVKGEKP